MRGHNHVIVSYENGSGLMEELESLKERLSIVEQNNSILNQNVSTLNQDNSILNQEVNKLNKKAGAGDRIRWRLANTMLRDHPDIGIPYNLRADPKIVRLGNITAHDADADTDYHVFETNPIMFKALYGIQRDSFSRWQHKTSIVAMLNTFFNNRFALDAAFVQEFQSLVALLEDPNIQFLSLYRQVDSILQVPQVLIENGQTVTFRDVYDKEERILNLSRQ